MSSRRFKQVCIQEETYNKIRERYPRYSIDTAMRILLDRRRDKDI